VTAVELAGRTRGLPLAALLYTDVARDGLLGGTDAQGTHRLAMTTDVPVLASGGVGGLDDLTPLVHSNVHGVVIGRAIYENKIDLPRAIALTRGDAV
jgi:phosphoribosylformimino-5-aminoimidazole carboxamide ribotide isomerase